MRHVNFEYTLSPARTSIISCNTAITKNYLFAEITRIWLAILMLMGKVYKNAPMFGLNGVGILMQYMSVNIK